MIKCGFFNYDNNLILNSKILLNSTLDVIKLHDNGLSDLIYKKYFNEKLKKLAEEISTNLEISINDIVLSNLIYDLLLGSLGCSTIAFVEDNKPVIYRNMDWIPAPLVARASTILDLDDGSHAGVYGQIGVVSATCNRGFSLCLNAVYSGGPNLEGYPVLMFLRKVMDEAENYKEAKLMLCKEKLMSGALVTLIGSEKDELCVIERSQTNYNIRLPINGFLSTTNHYQVNNSEYCSRLSFIKDNFLNYLNNYF
jgi:predicted choloylglycine hydrolase